MGIEHQSLDPEFTKRLQAASSGELDLPSGPTPLFLGLGHAARLGADSDNPPAGPTYKPEYEQED